ncbi:MAG: hypothetical protein ACPGWR_07920, partial [Ardenticatenaceae bacterium]
DLRYPAEQEASHSACYFFATDSVRRAANRAMARWILRDQDYQSIIFPLEESTQHIAWRMPNQKMEEPKMKYPFRDDYAVQVWSEEREADIPETAHFFKEIYHIDLWGLVSHIRFVPAFSRSSEYWPLTGLPKCGCCAFGT